MRRGRHLNGEEWQKTYILINDAFQYSMRLALQKEKELKTLLHKEKKLILILDLDNTLLHSRTVRGYVHSPTHKGRLYKGKDMFQIPISGSEAGFCTHTKFRPFLKQFIEMLQPLFKIYIYTMGNRNYATTIMQFMKKEIPDFDISETKVISRDDGHDHTEGKLVKTLRQLSPSDQSFYMILDDKSDVWPESGRNLLKVYPYVYFTGKEDEMLRGYPEYFKYFTQKDIDPFLLFYGIYLKTIHDKYYQKAEELGETAISVDLRDIYAEEYKSLFTGINCCYVKLFPPEVKSHQETYEWFHTDKRGMNNMYEYKKGETNLVITDNRYVP